MAEEARCGCGRLKIEADRQNYHVSSVRYTFFHCPCGYEWTESHHDVDPRDPISSEEQIELHERLKREDFTFKDLLG